MAACGSRAATPASFDGMRQTLRSVDAPSSVPVDVCVNARKGVSGTVSVCVHTPLATSHVRRVPSKPALYAFSEEDEEVEANMTAETRAVWPLSTASGALRIAVSSVSILRRLLPGPEVGKDTKGASCVLGIAVSQNPMSVSHDAVRRCVPVGEAAMAERGAVCRCSDATDAAFDVEEMQKRVRRAERSCEAVAKRMLSTSVADEGEGTRVIALIGALCA